MKDKNRIYGASRMEQAYEEYYEMFLKGDISAKAWEEVCINYLEYLMKENKKVLDRLKKI